MKLLINHIDQFIETKFIVAKDSGGFLLGCSSEVKLSFLSLSCSATDAKYLLEKWKVLTRQYSVENW